MSKTKRTLVCWVSVPLMLTCLIVVARSILFLVHWPLSLLDAGIAHPFVGVVAIWFLFYAMCLLLLFLMRSLLSGTVSCAVYAQRKNRVH